jgi:TrmH family RNA methyltransferase
MSISSRSNPAIRDIRALRDRRRRETTGLFFVEGIRIVVEAVESGAEVVQVVIAPQLLRGEVAGEAIDRARSRGTGILEVSDDVFRTLSVKEGPQGIGAVARQRWHRLDDVDPESDLCWTALDGIQDPGNLGTILRTSDAVGGAGIILMGATADPYDPKALRASMGSVFSQRLIRASFEEMVGWCRNRNVWLVGTSDRGDRDYREVVYRPPVALLMGGEREGLSADQLAACDEVASIPMQGHSDSLNVAVAVGVVLYEISYRCKDREKAAVDRARLK